MVLEGRPTDEIEELVDFTTQLELPTTLVEVGLSVEATDDIADVARARRRFRARPYTTCRSR